MTRRPYPAYKPSGVDWLGDIPAHWKIGRIRHAVDVRFSNVDKKTEDGERPVKLANYVDVYYQDFITSEIDFMEASATDAEISQFQLSAGDVLITKDSESWDDIAIPAFVPDELPGVLCGYHLAILRPPSFTQGRFLAWTLRSAPVTYQFHIEATGITRYGLSQGGIKNALIPLLPLPEQHAIADFLDRETANIDDLIAAHDDLIALLTEKRQAVISHAVTRGLDPSAPLKPSGVDWLGDVPAHWKVMRQKLLYSDVSGGQWGDEPEQSEVDVVCVRVADFDRHARRVATDNLTVRSFPRTVVERLKLTKGDLVIEKSGGGELQPVGAVVLFEHDFTAITSNFMARLRVGDGSSSHYLNFLHSALYFGGIVTRFIKQTTGIQNLDVSAYLAAEVPLPPLTEQYAIADYLDRKTVRIDTLIAESRTAIDLLRERRAALITAAVTGQIDVREAAHARP